MSDSKRSRNPRQVVATARRADALFKAMAADFLLREQFVTDPLQVLSEYVHGEALDPELATVGNALVYAAIVNPRLVRWLREYVGTRWDNPPPAEEFAARFSAAVVACGADDLVKALIDCSVSGKSLATLAQSFPLFELLTMVFGGDVPAPRPADAATWTGPDSTSDATALTGRATFVTGRVTERVPLTQPMTMRTTEPDVTEVMTAITLRATFITGRVTERIPLTQPLVTAATFITDRYSATQTGPTQQSTDTGPTTKSTDTGPTTKSTDTGPTTQSTDTGPTTKSTDTGPTTQSTDTGPGDRWGRGGGLQLDDFGSSHWALSLHSLAMYATELKGKGLLGQGFDPRP